MEQTLSYQEMGKKFTLRRMIKNSYVGNLSHDATDDTIRQAFEAFGQVASRELLKTSKMASPAGSVL
jgi:RNA recognition motif-containing protein